VILLQGDKKYLLGCAESAAKFINEKGSGSFLNLFLDIIEAAKHKFEDESLRKQYFCDILYYTKNSKIDRSFLGGSGTLLDSFRSFIEDFLQISKEKDVYIINNKTFADLTVEELQYVLGWTRRLVKRQNSKEVRDITDKKQSYKKSQKVFSANQREEHFNTMAAAFKKANWRK